MITITLLYLILNIFHEEVGEVLHFKLKKMKAFSWIILYFLLIFLLLLNQTNVNAQSCTNLTVSFSYSLNNNGCTSPDTIQLTNTSSGTQSGTSTFYWFVNGSCFDTTSGLSSPVSLIKNSGTYRITLLALTNANCIDSFYQNITVNQPLSVDFSMLSDTICKDSRAFFTNTTTGDTSATYYWTFGNNQTSTNSDTVSVKYSSTGSYNVNLKIIQSGCAYNKSKTIVVQNGRPPIRFYNNLGIALQNVTWKRCISLVTDPDSFTQSFASPDTLYNYYISFGDGSFSSGSVLLPYPNGIIKHTYLKTGLFDIYVISRDSNSCERIFYGTVINLRYPVVGIGGPDNGHSNGCIPFTTSFKNTSTHVSSCTQFTWDFGDGITETYNYKNQGDSVYHIYKSSSCSLYVKLTATNSCGSTQATWGPVNAYTKDLAKISADKYVLCYPNNTINLSNNTEFNCYQGTKFFFWDFGDGTNSGWTTIAAGPTHKFNNPGKYTVLLKDSNLCGTDTANISVTIYGPLQAGFKYSPSNVGCKEYQVSFTDTSKGDNLTYFWEFGDNDTSTLQNPVHTFKDTGTYNVKLTIKGSCGTSVASSKIYVYKKPVASIRTIDNQCLPAKVKYFNTSKDYSPYIKYTWHLGNGNTSSMVNPDDVIFSNPGTYTVKLLAYDTCGVDSTMITFTVYDLPSALFSADTVCEGIPTSFYNMSSIMPNNGSLSKFYWNFGDNSNSTSTNPTHIYNKKGVYNVSLVAESSYGCKDTVFTDVLIKENPSVSFSLNPGEEACKGQTLIFSGSASISSGTISSYLWKFGDSSTATTLSANHSYSDFGKYTVVFYAFSDNGCKDSVVREINIYNQPQADFSYSATCEKNNVLFTDLSKTVNSGTISNWSWDFTNNGNYESYAQNPSAVYDTAGNYNVKLKIKSQYGCFDSIIKTISIQPKPVVSFTVSKDTFCQNETVTFTNNSTYSDSCIWNFNDNGLLEYTKGNSSISHHFAKSGSLNVVLKAISQYGCETSDSLKVTVNPLPDAEFISSADSGCAPLTVSFSNLSTNSDSFFWYVNGTLSSTSSTLSPKTFTNPNDSFTVSLITKNKFNCKADTASRNFYTFKNPVPSFSANIKKGCGPLTVKFINNSQNANYYIWHFGDGTSSTDSDPQHTFQPSSSNDTFYVVVMKAYSSISCIDSATDTIYVYPIPDVNFNLSTSSGCGPLNVQFSNTSSPKDTGSIYIMSFKWDLGNGLTSSQIHTSASYVASNTHDSLYTIKLTGYSEHGCVDSIEKTITVYPNPLVVFTASQTMGCNPLQVSFSNLSSPNDTGNISMMSFVWNFGNGQTSTQTHPTVSFQNKSFGDTIYTVLLTAYTEHYCSDTHSIKITVHPDPVSAFSQDKTTGCDPLEVKFTNNSNPNGSGSISDMTYLWDFGNGVTSVATNPIINFSSAKFSDTTYLIRLVAFSLFGCSDTSYNTVHVNPLPFVDFTLSDTAKCGPAMITFTNNSKPLDTGSYVTDLSFYWDFGNGKTSASKDEIVTFSASSFADTTYQISLKTVSKYGCAKTITKTITVFPSPLVVFAQDKTKGCGPLSVTFTNNSDPKDTGNIDMMSFVWDFGNGITSSDKNKSITFYGSEYGDTIYYVKLIGYSEHGCKDSFTSSITVYPQPVSKFSVNTTNGCGPLSVSFINLSTQHKGLNNSTSGLTYLWNFGNGVTSSVKDTQILYSASANNDTTYSVTLKTINSNGCYSESSNKITIYPKPYVNFNPTINKGCGPLSVSFNNISTPKDTGTIDIMSFVWNLGNGITKNTQNASTIYYASLTQDTIYYASLTGYSEHGCKDSVTKSITVYPNPTVKFTTNANNGCNPLYISFNNNSKPNDTGSIYIMNFMWDLGNGGTSTSRNPQTYYFNNGDYDKKFTVTLIGFNEHNCSDTFKSEINVFPTPYVNFSSDNVAGCSPLSVKFTNLSSPKDTGNIGMMSFKWMINNSLKSTNQSFNATFFDSKTQDSVYQVKLVGVSEHGCFDSIIKTIRVYPHPKVSFIASPKEGCGPLTVSFKNTSSPNDTGSINIMSFSWDFGNGISSTKTDTSVIFYPAMKKDTIYRVILTGYSEHGCIAYDTQYIKVHPGPEVSFNVSNEKGCSPLKVNFTNATNVSQGCNPAKTIYKWYFGNGDSSTTNNPATTYLNNQNQTITYTVKLFATDEFGCISSSNREIEVNPKPEVSFYVTDTSACDLLKARFINTSQPHDPQNYMNYFWDLGNSLYAISKDTVSEYKADKNGEKKYKVVLYGMNSYGCNDSFEKQLVVYSLPEADFSFSNKNDCGNNVVFSNLSKPNDNKTINSMSFTWNYGNQKLSNNISDTVTFLPSVTKDTTYQVTLIAQNTYGCKDTAIRSLKVHPKPIISFSASTYETCSGVNVFFTNTSKNLDSMTWYFGDGTTSVLQNPSHIYTNNSPSAYLFNVKLFGSSSYGCFGDTARQNILIHPVQSADIITSNDSGCSPLTINFYNNSHNSSLFQWFVSGTMLSTSTNLNYTFSGSTYRDTVYEVKLVATNNIGCSDTAVKLIKVFQQVVADFDMSTASSCSPSQVSFVNRSSGAINYFWNLGNGQTSSDYHPNATYSNYFFQDVFYEVTLFAISKHNCFSSVKKTVTVHPTPLASFTADKLQGCDPVVVNFTNQSIIADSYLWSFDDGVTSTLQEPAHVFLANGKIQTYKIKLTATTQYGCSHSFESTIKVYPSPKALFNTSDSGCVPVLVNFEDMSSNASFWNWEFGDGHTSSEKNPVHIYQKPGEYSVKLRVSNYLGCSDTFTMYRNIKAWESPTAEFIADKYYSEYPDMTFNFSSLSPSGLIHHWSFGEDRVIKTTNNVTYSFKDTGVYQVRLVVSTQHCNDTSIKVIIIAPPYPKADFIYSVQEGCMPLKVSFTDKSLMATEWLWYFGDGEYSKEQNPVHEYKIPGLFSVTLISSNTRGSNAIFKKGIIMVNPKPSVYFEVSPTPAYLPKAKVDLVNLTVNGSSYQWFIDDEFLDTLENTSKIFYEPGFHDVTLVAVSKHGCADTLTRENIIRIDTMGQIWMPNAFTPNHDGKNDVFAPVGFGYGNTGFKLTIYNRWGEKIFETDKFEEGWDGTYNGELCMEGIYIYQVTVTMVNNETRHMEGRVHLIR